MFRSFFLAGFEGSTGYNRHGQWFDQVAATGHDRSVDQDYRDLAALGIHAARETVRWPLVDRGGPLRFLQPGAVRPRGAGERHRSHLGPFPLRLSAGRRPLGRRLPGALRRILLRGRALSRPRRRGALCHAGQRAVLHGLCGRREGAVRALRPGARLGAQGRAHRAPPSPASTPSGSPARKRGSSMSIRCAGWRRRPAGRTLPRRRATSTSASSSRAGTC